jgi:DNA glycosylase AlkZ-like
VTGNRFEKPEDVVSWLGAVQAQDYPSAQWAVGQRLKDGSADGVDAAFANGTILRTHVMRPTWHFVVPADIRWLLGLTGPRVNAICGTYYRKFGLDDRTFAKSRAALIAAMTGGNYLTRSAVRRVLEKARIVRPADDPLRLIFLLIRAELDAVICSGPRVGKQFTYALLDERVPNGQILKRGEAAAALARRYFVSHGPATMKDFMWWSGLTAAAARAGHGAIASELIEDVLGGVKYWGPPPSKLKSDPHATAYLLAAFDEGLLSYRDNRTELARYGPQLTVANGYAIVIDGRVVGTWRRTVRASTVTIQTTPFDTFTRRQMNAVNEAAERYGRFLGMNVAVV